jgi:hypothetical protein
LHFLAPLLLLSFPSLLLLPLLLGLHLLVKLTFPLLTLPLFLVSRRVFNEVGASATVPKARRRKQLLG